jgi:DMSO/TMAO reductase YedYZ molybdopterin-dependent catalytic subunit
MTTTATAATADLNLPVVGDGSGLESDGRLYVEELQLATRNHALPLEALRYDVTPTGLHYTLVHYDIPAVDPASWRLALDGALRRPLTLTLGELQRRPERTVRVTLECAGDGRALLSPRPLSQPWLTGAVGTADWTGTALQPLLEEAGLDNGVVELLFTGLDRGIEGGVEQDYQRSLPLAEALHADALLAWAMNGQPLEPQHGAPLRLIIPGWYGMAHVKWLRSISALTEPFTGYQNASAYRYSQSRAEAGESVTLMRVRSLMVPPGIPDFLTRMRVVARGPVALTGRAWSGRAAITRVEVSTDGGDSWAPTELRPPSHPHAWQAWHYAWDASTPGVYELLCRAEDATGAVQPVEQHWTARGMGNNAAQRVRVQVR